MKYENKLWIELPSNCLFGHLDLLIKYKSSSTAKLILHFILSHV